MDQHALRYRPATPEDAEACIELRGRTSENAVPREQLAALGITAQSWGDDIRSGALPGHVCLAGGRIIGYCFGARASGEVIVLALDPAFERRGIGRRLLDLVVAELSGFGFQRFFLGCSADPSSRSHGFYRRAGWRPTGQIDRYGDEELELKL